MRRIFEEIAQGRGFARIAKGLNRDAVQGPRGRGWAMTGVREMVFRDLYRGRIVWGKTRWVDQPETARPILRKLLVGRLTLTPQLTDAGRFYSTKSAGARPTGGCSKDWCV